MTGGFHVEEATWVKLNPARDRVEKVLRMLSLLAIEWFGSSPVRRMVLPLGVAVVLVNFWHSPGVAASERAVRYSPTSSLPGHIDTPPDPESPAANIPGQFNTRSPAISSRLMLPDLRTLPPDDLEIVILPDGSRELRLSNTIWNSGAGALELEGETNPHTRMTRVVQIVHVRAGAELAHLVGEFVWHPTHDHWHFAGFSIYELWTLGSSGMLAEIVSSSGKVSYCLIDTDVIDRQNQSFEPRRGYYGCGRGLQGLSAGWGDTYKSFLDGQEIHLAGIEDGFYALKSTTNPDLSLLEANYHNNAAVLYLNIQGTRLELIDPEELAERRCPENGWC